MSDQPLRRYVFEVAVAAPDESMGLTLLADALKAAAKAGFPAIDWIRIAPEPVRAEDFDVEAWYGLSE